MYCLGLKDILYYSRGHLATNREPTERAVRIVQDRGYELTTPTVARAMLNLPPLS